MSFDFRTIRQPSGDPLLKFVNHLQRALSKKLTKDLVDQMDDSEDIYSIGQDVDSAVKVQTDINYNNTFNFNKAYYAPIDSNFVTCWIRGRGMGSVVRDYSEYNNNATINAGEPILVNGSPFDYFIFNENLGAPSTALRFNRTTSPDHNNEHLVIPETSDLRITSLVTGFSIFIRFRLQSLEETSDRSTTLYEKIDDNTPNNGFMLQVHTDGGLLAVVKKGGATTAKKTDVGIIEPNTVYDVWITYAVSGPTLKIYVDNGELPISDWTPTINWQNDLTNHNLWLMNRGYLSQGWAHGDLYDFKFYQKEKIVSLTEVQNHYTNKLSISAIPVGQVIIANYWSPITITERITLTGTYRYDIAGSVSELASFTSTCFTGAFTI